MEGSKLTYNDILVFAFSQGGCRTGMAKVTNAYDLPARLSLNFDLLNVVLVDYGS